MTGLFDIILFKVVYAITSIFLHSFLLPNNIPVYAYATFCLSFHHLMDIYVVSNLQLFWIMLPWPHVQVYVWTYAVNSVGIYIGIELLDHMVSLSITFWETTKFFSKVAVPFYNVKDFTSSAFSLTLTIWSTFLIIAILVGVKWHLNVVLTYI